jgi:hypothetical protein
MKEDELSSERVFDTMFADDKEFESKFLLTPNIAEDEDYRHLDKNLATTNFVSKLREPEQARIMLSALHTITNDKYSFQATKLVVKGYSIVEEQVVDENGEEFTIEKEVPVYRQKVVVSNRFPKTYHKLKAKFYSFTTTSAARGGHLIKLSRTKNLRQEQTLDDKTKNKTTFGFFKNKNSGNEGDW